MNNAQVLDRHEMKSIMAGFCECCQACTDFQGHCINACIDAFDPWQDDYAYCIDLCHLQTHYCLQCAN